MEERGKENAPGGKGVGKGTWVLLKESHTGSFVLRVLFWRSQGRIQVEYTSAFQVCPFRVVVTTDWSALG